MQIVKHVYDDTLTKIDKAKEKYESNYNKGKREEQFKEGDLIWKIDRELSSANKDISAKLNMRYNGPFVIARKVGKDMYTLKQKGKLIKSTFHAKDFKRCTTNINEQQEINETAVDEQPTTKKRGRPKHITTSSKEKARKRSYRQRRADRERRTSANKKKTNQRNP